MKKHLIFILIFLILPVLLYSQLFQEDYRTINDSVSLEKNLHLHILGATFFNNNEFFNPLQEGYTLIGGFLHPEVIYLINPKLSLSAGLHIRKFYGDNELVHFEPLFTIKYRINNDLIVSMGSFDGGQNHRLPETIFAFENHFSKFVENGILIDVHKKYIETQAWLNWETFIEPGDPFREVFTAGIMNRIKVYQNESVNVEIPVIILAHHSGGQINNSPLPVESLFNLCEGIKVNFKSDNSIFQKISPYAEFLIHHSLGDYSTGSGLANQFTLGVEMKRFEVNTGFFLGHDFNSFYGLPLYRSYSETGYHQYSLGGKSKMLSFKTGYKVKMANSAFLFLRFEGYYNFQFQKFDYTYGIHFQVNDFIGLANLKKGKN